MKAKTYLITDIDPGLWKDFKAACAHYDLSMRVVFIKHIQNIVDDYRIQKGFKPPSIIKPKRRGKQ